MWASQCRACLQVKLEHLRGLLPYNKALTALSAAADVAHTDFSGVPFTKLSVDKAQADFLLVQQKTCRLSQRGCLPLSSVTQETGAPLKFLPGTKG